MRNPSKDRNLREKKNIFTEELVGNLVDMILGDKSYPERDWNRRIALVKKVMKDLKDPQFVLERLTSLIMKENKSFHDVRKAESALQQLQSFLQSKNIVPNQDCANEIHKSPPDSILLNQNGGLLIKAKALQEAEEESLSSGENFKQIMAILEQEDQPVTMQQKAVDSFVNMAACDLLKEDFANLVQEHHGVEVEGEQLRFNFPQIPDSIQFNQKGKNAEFHNQEFLVIQRDTGNCGNFLNLEGLNSSEEQLLYSLILGDGDVTGTSDAAKNEANVKLSHDETCIIEGYKVFNRNANALTDIFQKYPNIFENFQAAHTDLQSHLMNLLAEVFQKIRKSNQEMLGLEEMLAEIREMLENQEAHRKLLEEISSCEAKEKELKQKLARLEKKRRFQ